MNRDISPKKTDLWLIHPRVIHTSVSLCFLEGVSRVNRDPFLRVIQGHVSRFVSVALTDLLQLDVDDPPWWRPHVQGVLASLYVIKVMHDGRRCEIIDYKN